MALLSHDEFLGTFGEPQSRLSADSAPSLDYWPYFDAIPATDFEGHDCSAGQVDYVWRQASGFDHILVNSEDRNVFMVLVVDRTKSTVYGHRLLDLNREYGLDGKSSD